MKSFKSNFFWWSKFPLPSTDKNITTLSDFIILCLLFFQCALLFRLELLYVSTYTHYNYYPFIVIGHVKRVCDFQLLAKISTLHGHQPYIFCQVHSLQVINNWLLPSLPRSSMALWPLYFQKGTLVDPWVRLFHMPKPNTY